MQCSVCGSQDTKAVSGVSKKTGNPWKAYDCQEKECKNDKGYPNRTFVPTARAKGATKSAPAISGTLEKKVDMILAILEKNFGKVTIAKPDEEEVPF